MSSRARFGAAVDIGTSKVIVYLFDLQGTAGSSTRRQIENPQMRYGEDVVTPHDPGRWA